MKRYLSIFLAVVLMFCATMALADDTVLHGYTSTWDNYGLDKTPITLTIGCGQQDLPASYENNLQLELIYQATGVRLQFVGYDTEKFAVKVAGGDLPDIFSLENSTVVNDLIDSEAVLDMAPYLDAYGENIKQVHSDYALTWSKAVYGQGEHIYLIPSNTRWLGDTKLAADNVSFNYFVRWDIYQAIGAPAITDENGFNEDLLLNVFKQMQDYAREKMGSDNVYALSGWYDWGAGWAALLPYCIGCASKINSYKSAVTGYVEDIDLYGDENSHYYNALRFYNKAWNMGILDPELFTLTQGQYDAKVRRGEVIVANDCWFSASSMEQSVLDVFGDDCNFYIIKGMPYFFSLLTQSDPVGYGIFAADFINADCEYPERAVAVLDYLRSDEFCRANSCGLQGIHWDYDETGKPVFIGDALTARENGTMTEYWDVANGNYKYFPATKLGMASKICTDGYPSDFTSSADYVMEKASGNESLQNYIAFYGSEARYAGELYLEWINEGIANGDAAFNPKTAFKPAASDEINSLISKCDSYFTDNSAKVIFADSAEEAEAEIARIAAACRDMGSAKILESELAGETQSFQTAEEMGF